MTAFTVVIPHSRISIVRSSSIDPDSPRCPSGLSTGLPYIHLCILERERSRRRCSLETIPCTAVDAGRRFASEHVVNPHSSSVCGERQDVVTTADLHGVLREYYH